MESSDVGIQPQEDLQRWSALTERMNTGVDDTGQTSAFPVDESVNAKIVIW